MTIVICANARVIPPIAGITQPHSLFTGAAKCLYPSTHGEILPEKECMKVGVSAFGFGNMNVHGTYFIVHSISLFSFHVVNNFLAYCCITRVAVMSSLVSRSRTP